MKRLGVNAKMVVKEIGQMKTAVCVELCVCDRLTICSFSQVSRKRQTSQLCWFVKFLRLFTFLLPEIVGLVIGIVCI